MTINQHQIIEASAGTGKTYTIENQVVQLIVDEGIPLTEILIVTFTEKATGELRRRIREKLESEWRNNPNGINKVQLRTSIDNFDDAAIYTIHGFCKRMLSEYAFEAKLPFNQQQLEDPQLLDRLFSRSLRGYWRRNILTDDDPTRCQDAYKNEFYKKDIQSVVDKFMPGDELIPSASTKLLSTKDAVINIVTTLEVTFGMKIPDNVATTKFIVDLTSLAINASTKKSLLTHYTTFLTFLNEYQSQGMTDDITDKFLNWSPSDTVNNNFSTLVEKLLLRNEDVAAFTQLLSLKNDLAGGVKSHAIMQLFNSKNRYKNDGGFIDFNDMLLLMREATSPSSPLVNILRQRYQVALVDEFQDTDQIQWDIFRNVFTGDNTHRLIVVGDPKQAIYGFRGANVKIYSAARDTLLKDSAQQKYLDTNWRSYPPLISALNELFNENAQWFKDTGAEHKDINSPDKSKVRPRLYSDESNRRPLSLVELPDQITGTRAKFSYSRFVAKEIQHLLNSNIEIVEWRDKSPFRRPLHLGDICILIRSRSELPAIKYALREANIPYTFPKQGGLFATIEAEEWRYLLRAIAAPDDPGAVMSALLTRFFKCVPETLGNYPLLPVTHPLKMTFAHWHHLAENRLWALLFQSIFADTGILERVLPTDDGERIVTNYQHLVQILHEQAVRTRGNIDDMILFLDNKCLRKDDENTDLQRIETERRKVKIMTMHGSKGLEFEIVFIAGGFTNSKTRQSSGYTTDQGRKYVFNDDKEHKEAQKNEEEADSRRLFYVALTRAKYKLYIPYISNQKGGKGALGSFIATAINSAWPDKNKANNDRFAFINIENNSSLPIWKAPVDDASGVILLSTNDKISNIDESSIIIPEINPEWGHRITRVHSFSSLSEHAESASETPELQFSSANNLTDDKQTITDDATDSGIKDNDDLPHGAQTGTLLHAILEEIDYPAVLAAADYNELLRDGSSTRATILNLLNRYPLPGNKPAEDYYEKIAHIVWQTLRTPMPFLNNTPLAALTDRRHELEFWLPANSIDITIPDVTLNHNYLSGFIDLIFRYEGRYYILDWKSNWSPTGDYSRNALDVVIHNNKYDLQYSIYSMALDKFLRMSLTGYNPVKDLGGVCYLFLRGVGDGENGIYYVPASDIIITDINKDVSTRLMNKIAEVR